LAILSLKWTTLFTGKLFILSKNSYHNKEEYEEDDEEEDEEYQPKQAEGPVGQL
jgi:hypothetical protein